MKKIISIALLGSSILSTQMLANDMYVGLDAISSSTTFTLEALGTEVDADDDAKAFKLKLGTVNDNGFRVQLYYLHETYDIPVFDASNDVLNEIGVDIIQGFEVTPEFSPFIQAGLGYGWMNVDGYTDSSIAEYSLKIGVGVMYKVVESVELIAGVDLEYRRWQDISYGAVTVETSEKSTKLYVGANYRF